jgi:hypothetical protein
MTHFGLSGAFADRRWVIELCGYIGVLWDTHHLWVDVMFQWAFVASPNNADDGSSFGSVEHFQRCVEYECSLY